MSPSGNEPVGHRRDAHASLVVVDDQWWFLAPGRDTATLVGRPEGAALQSLAGAVAAVESEMPLGPRTVAFIASLRNAEALGLVEACDGEPSDVSASVGGADPHSEIERYRTLGHSVSYVDYADPAVFDDDRARMTAYEADDQAPPTYKEVEGEEPIALPHPACMRCCTTARERLGKLLFWPFGRVRAGTFLGQLSAQLKAVPSQGARHPLELYVAVVGDAEPLPEGLYHYDPRRHALSRLDEPPPVTTRPGTTLHVTAVFERYQWRYRDRWVYKDLFFEVGHVAATLRMVAEDTGLSIQEVDAGVGAELAAWPWLVEDCLAAYAVTGWGTP